MGVRLVDLLQAELKNLDNPRQKARFRKELAKTLPVAIETAADAAKKAPETAPVENNSPKLQEKRG